MLEHAGCQLLLDDTCKQGATPSVLGHSITDAHYKREEALVHLLTRQWNKGGTRMPVENVITTAAMFTGLANQPRHSRSIKPNTNPSTNRTSNLNPMPDHP
jgi:hypothetical protein